MNTFNSIILGSQEDSQFPEKLVAVDDAVLTITSIEPSKKAEEADHVAYATASVEGFEDGIASQRYDLSTRGGRNALLILAKLCGAPSKLTVAEAIEFAVGCSVTADLDETHGNWNNLPISTLL